MTKEEKKANELIERFEHHTKETTFSANWEDINHTKQCALICVDEIIKELQSCKTRCRYKYEHNVIAIEIKELQEVKNIIKNK